jgi:hypothetical protein
MKKLIIIIILLTVISCEKELHQDISDTFLEIYSDLEYDGDVYIFNYPNNATNSYFKVNYNSLPTQRVYWDSPDEFYVIMWQDTVWTPVVNYSTYSDDDGIGHQMVYVNPTLIGDTLNIIGTIYEEGLTKEILIKIQ